tara:strand:- start:838 stop:1116 length:279 start_codon:yes stop_codon:yes gene_type:complete
MPLYKLEYEQRSEVFVEAQDHDEARELITEYTENGGSNMHQIRLIECGWSITENLGELTELSDDHPNRDFDTHTAEYGGTFQQQHPTWMYYD